jgi:hypothetical protein
MPRAPSIRRGTQQIVIELTDVFDRLFQLLIIVEPPPNLSNPLATYAELLRTPARVSHSQNEHLMSLTAGAFQATFRMSDGTFKQRTPQQFAAHWKLADKLVARLKSSIANHLLE